MVNPAFKAVVFILLNAISFNCFSDLTNEDYDWLEKSRDILNQVGDAKKRDALDLSNEVTEKQLDHIKNISDHSSKIIEEKFSQEINEKVDLVKQENKELHYIFISFGMPDENLKALIEEGSKVGASFILRGLKEGTTTITETMLAIKDLAATIKPTPSISLDPTLFELFNVENVPRMIMAKNKKLLAVVEGDISPSWFKDKYEANPAKKDYSKKGPTWDITERNLINEMKERMEAIDWAKKKQEVVENYWSKHEGFGLPEAKESSVYQVDPTVVIQKDIKAPDGQYIARSGDTFNPLKRLPFNQAFAVFNPASELQVNAIIDAREKYSSSFSTLTLMINKMPEGSGWDDFNALQDRFRLPIYNVQKDIIKRFRIKNLPVFIYAQGDHFNVVEIGINNEG